MNRENPEERGGTKSMEPSILGKDSISIWIWDKMNKMTKKTTTLIYYHKNINKLL